MATVTIAGVSGSTTVDVTAEDTTVKDVLAAAADKLGFKDVDLGTLAPVVNGEDADENTIVKDEDDVSAAPAVENG